MIRLNANDVFQIAEKMERDGAEFYRAAARGADDNQRSVLLALAEMEFNHERIFAAMRSEFARDNPYPTECPPDSPCALYLKAAVDGIIFSQQPATKLTGDESVDEIFETAITLEKDSIVFYQSMKSVAPPGQARDQIDEIIEQEIGHILELTRE